MDEVVAESGGGRLVPDVEFPPPYLEREALIDLILNDDSKLVVLAAGSGMGKSSLLADVQRHSGDGAPEPTPLRRSAGSLQSGLMDQLAAALAPRTRAEAFQDIVVAATKRFLKDKKSELGRVVAKEVLNALKARLGDGVGDAIAEYIDDLTISHEERLEERLATMADGGVLREVIGLLREVVEALDPSEPISLALDDLNHLSDPDFDLLLDLFRSLPDGVTLKAAYATDRAADHRLTVLRSDGARVIEVPPFNLAEVHALLVLGGLEPDSAESILGETDGVPLAVQDAIRHIRRGESLSSLALNSTMLGRTQEAWKSADRVARSAAARLSAFPAALTDEAAAQVLDMKVAEWGEIQRDLLSAGVFIRHARGHLWFHEQRRRCVLTEVLTPAQREEAARVARDYMVTRLQASGDTQYVMMLAQVAAQVPALYAGTKAHAVLELSRDELALMAALLEAGQPAEHFGMTSDVLFDYARTAFGGDGDLIAAVESLQAKDLVAVASNEHSMAVVPVLESIDTMHAIVGRAGLELGRTPLPGAANLFFESTLRPLLGAFTTAMFGLGNGKIAELTKHADHSRYENSDGVVTVNGRAFGILARGRFREMPVYAVVAYLSDGERDTALQRLESAAGGADLTLTQLLSVPASAVPSLRWTHALASAFDRTVSLDRIKEEQISTRLGEAAAEMLTIRDTIRSRCPTGEMEAYGLDQPLGYVVSRSPQGFLRAEVIGATAPAREIDRDELGPVHDPHVRFHISRAAKLNSGERIGRLTEHWGSESFDPVKTIDDELRSSARSFNASAIRHQQELSAVALESALTEAAIRRYEDALAIRAAASTAPHAPVVPLDYELVLFLDGPEPGWVCGANAVVVHRTRPSQGSTPVASAREVPAVGARPDQSALAALLAEWHGDTHGYGQANSIISEMLDYADEDIAFNYAPPTLEA